MESTKIGVDLSNVDGSIINESVNITSTSSHVEDADETDQNVSETDEVFTRNSETIRKRKDLLDNKLSAYKHECMKRKLPVDAQLLSCAQEELAIKRKLVEQMDTFEKKYSETMTTLSSNMDKLANSISDGFSLLKHLLMTPFNHQHPIIKLINFLRCIIISHLLVVTLFLNHLTLNLNKY